MAEFQVLSDGLDKQLAITWDIKSTIGLANSLSFTGPLLTTNTLSSHHLCLDLPTASTGWVPTPIGSRPESVCWVLTWMVANSLQVGPLKRGEKLPSVLMNTTTRYGVALMFIFKANLHFRNIVINTFHIPQLNRCLSDVITSGRRRHSPISGRMTSCR